jgi:uncharacterized membrane protein
MAHTKGPIYLLVATYPNEDAAEADYEAIWKLHHTGVVGTYDAALVTRDEKGKIHIHKREKPTQHGAWTGVGVGALIGLVFPPGMIVTAAAGGLAGGLIAHLEKGMSRKQVKDIGDHLESGQAALVVIGPGLLKEVLGDAVQSAERVEEHEIQADAGVLEETIKDAGAD